MPHAVAGGHYCCKNVTQDGQCELTATVDLLPCASPRCKSSKTIQRDDWQCPDEFPYSLNLGQHCCRHSVAKDECGTERIGWGHGLECCPYDEVVGCPYGFCSDSDVRKSKNVLWKPFEEEEALVFITVTCGCA